MVGSGFEAGLRCLGFRDDGLVAEDSVSDELLGILRKEP